MKKRIAFILSAVFMVLTLTACGSPEPTGTPSVAENEKAVVQEKLNKNDGKSKETKLANDDKQETTASSAQETDTPNDSDSTNILVAYFSRADENYNVGTVEVGNTQIVAEYIAKEVGADSFHIETVTPYPADYDDCCDVAKKELNDKARPKLNGTVNNMEQYDIVFLGYPIWWGDMPMAVYTFMESYDFSDKVIIPFNTHEGSGEGGTYLNIAKILPNAQVLDGMSIQGKTAQEFSSATENSVREWLNELGF